MDKTHCHYHPAQPATWAQRIDRIILTASGGALAVSE